MVVSGCGYFLGGGGWWWRWWVVMGGATIYNSPFYFHTKNELMHIQNPVKHLR